MLKAKFDFQVFLAVIVSVGGVATCLKSEVFQNYYFTSDTLYSFDYFHSLKEGTLSSFQYSHLPNLFPEGFILLPLLALDVPWQLAYAFYSAVMFLVLTLSVRTIYMTMAPGRSNVAFYLFVLLAVPIFALHPGRLLHVVLAGIHGGSFVISVAAVILARRLLFATSRRPWALLCGLALITCATTFSDVLFVFEFVVPLLLASSILVLLHRLTLPRMLALNLAVLGAAAAGAALLHRLPISPFPPSSMQDLLENSLRFVSSVQMNIIVGSLLPFVAVFACFGALCLGSRSALTLFGSPPRDRANADAWLFYWVFGFAASAAGFGLTIVSYLDFGAYRYAISFFWWPLILAMVLLARPAFRFRALLPPTASLGAACLLIGALFWPKSTFWAADLANCLEQNSRTISMHAGLAEYWTARPLSHFLQRKIPVSQILENGDPYLWINNRLDYFVDKQETTLRDYDFIILDKLDPAQLASKFGPASHQFRCGTYSVAQYDDPSIIRATLAGWFARQR